MWRTLFISIFILISFGCDKQDAGSLEAYLHVRIEGEDEDIHWEELSCSWLHHSNEMEVEARGFQHKQFRMRLREIQATGTINITEIDQLFYADGVRFQSDAVAGRIEILDLSALAIRGTLVASFTDSQTNNVMHISGSFGIIGE